jgi:hypothetical protein
MTTEIDVELTPDQWETLKALRVPASKSHTLSRPVVEELIALEFAAMTDDRAAITPKGRSVLLRGSPRLWDVAA